MKLSDYIHGDLSREGRATAEQLIRGVEDIASKAVRLGKLLVSMSEADRVLFVDGFPSQYRALWSNLYKVGKKELHPRLVTASGRAAQALKRLPYPEQEAYIVDLIPVVVGRGDVKHMDIDAMGPEHVRQVFAQGGKHARVRTLEEQRQWLREQKKKPDKLLTESGIDRPNKWAIRNGRVYLAKPKIDRGLTAKDIETIWDDLDLG